MNRALLFILACSLSLQVSAAPPITAAAFTPDGQQVVIGSQAGIEIRKWPDLNEAARIDTDLANIHDLTFSPDGEKLLIAGGSPAERGVVDIVTWPERKLVHRIDEHADVVYRVAWSPAGNALATASGDSTCQIYEAATGNRIARYEGHSRAVLVLAFLPDGNSIVSAGVDQALQLWDSNTGKQLRSLDNHLAAVNDLAVRPTSNRDAPPIVATCSDDRTLRFWQPTIGRLMRFARLPSPSRCLAWSSDGKQVLAGCDDGLVRCLDFETLEVMALDGNLGGRIHVLLRSQEKSLAAGENGKTLTLK